MPIFPLNNPDGTLQLGQAAQRTDGYGYQFQGIENPVALAERVKITRTGSRSVFNVNGTYEIISGLNAKINLGGSNYTEKYEYYFPTNLSSGVNPAGSPQSVLAANASAQFLNIQDILGEFTLNYTKRLNKHSIDVLGGYTAQETKTDVVAVAAKILLTTTYLKSLVEVLFLVTFRGCQTLVNLPQPSCRTWAGLFTVTIKNIT
jgi:hypothetical protein